MRHKQLSLGYLLFALMLILAMQILMRTSNVQSLAYSDFKDLLKVGKHRDLQVGEQNITDMVNTKDIETLLPAKQAVALSRTGDSDRPFAMVRVSDPDLIHDLEAAKIRYVGEQLMGGPAALLGIATPGLLCHLELLRQARRLDHRRPDGDWQEQGTHRI